jgi:hypothetical protein
MNIMKKLNLPLIVLVIAILAMMAFIYPSRPSDRNNANPPQERVASPFPENVAKIFENSCFDCHSDASSNEKALAKMNLSKWNDLTAAKKVGRLQDIQDILKKGDMPPAKYAAKYPDRAPNKEQKDIIIKWAGEESDKLMGN